MPLETQRPLLIRTVIELKTSDCAIHRERYSQIPLGAENFTILKERLERKSFKSSYTCVERLLCCFMQRKDFNENDHASDMVYHDKRHLASAIISFVTKQNEDVVDISYSFQIVSTHTDEVLVEKGIPMDKDTIREVKLLAVTDSMPLVEKDLVRKIKTFPCLKKEMQGCFTVERLDKKLQSILSAVPTNLKRSASVSIESLQSSYGDYENGNNHNNLWRSSSESNLCNRALYDL